MYLGKYYDHTDIIQQYAFVYLKKKTYNIFMNLLNTLRTSAQAHFHSSNYI